MDKGKITALKNANWTNAQIAEDMGVSVEKVDKAVNRIQENEAKKQKKESEAKEPTVICLSGEDLNDLLDRAASIGAKAGIDKYREEMKASVKKKRDKRLRNTKLLLRNYRMLQIHTENSIFKRAQMQESVVDILESMMTMSDDELVVESIKRSATRTAIIVDHVRTMLDMYQICCEKSSNELDERRFDIIWGLYIADPKMTRKELSEKWSISSDTTYADEKIAIERLSALIFGIDGLG